MDKGDAAFLKRADIASQQLRITDDHRTVEGAGIGPGAFLLVRQAGKKDGGEPLLH